MLASITHRVTGIALAVGTLVLAWWLVSVSNGPEGYESFMAVADTPLGLVVLFGFAWSLAFHLLNGVRHLAWDLGYGFNKVTATQTGSLVYVLSLVVAIGIFAFVWTGHGGYLQ
jgi:succinate dehydrogenase / fumarate reductase cytochrome b subunit